MYDLWTGLFHSTFDTLYFHIHAFIDLSSLATSSTLIVPDSTGSLCARRHRAASNVSGDSQALVALRRAIDVVVVPDLVELSAAVVERSLAGLGLVVLGAAAADEGDGAVSKGQGILDVGEGVGGGVGRADVGGGEPAPGGEDLVVGDDGLEELEEVVVLVGLWPVALLVKGREAGGVLGELVGPELPVGGILVDPVLFHVGEEVHLSVRLEPGLD